jgi:hypothetical protein
MNSRVFLIANPLGWHGKSTVEMHGKLKMALHFDPTAKEKQWRDLVTDKEYSNI